MNVDGHECLLQSCVRLIPGKRMVYSARWQNKNVFVKLFIHPDSAERHWQRDVRGILTFSEKAILTPELLWKGEISKVDKLDLPKHAFAIILQAVPHAQSLLELWELAGNEGKKHLLEKILPVLAQHHSQGLVQTDLHFGNFLFGADKVYSLDGDALRIFSAKAVIREVAENLCLFIAQADVASEDLIIKNLNIYFESNPTVPQEEVLEYISKNLLKVRRNRCERFTKKVFRNCTAVKHVKWVGRRAWINTHFDNKDFRNFLHNPEKLFPEDSADLLKDGNSATVAVVELE